MKNITKWLLITALAPVLGFAQETPTKSQDLNARIAAAQSLDAAVALETEFAANLADFKPKDRATLAYQLMCAYQRAANRGEVPRGAWISNVLPKYISDWNQSTGPEVIAYYNTWITTPAIEDLKKAQTPAEFDSLVAAFFSKNQLPEWLHGVADSRTGLVKSTLDALSDTATRVGHSEAINYALAQYRVTGMQYAPMLNSAVNRVAVALKATDLNLTRANVWIEGQNTGTPAVVLTERETALPGAIQTISPSLPGILPVSLDAALQKYRAATTPATLDGAIYQVATALKARDLNLARANAWIKSQKDGTPFDMK